MEYIFRTILHGSISFSVDSANDAHIALTNQAKDSEPIIEIFLGGWKNTASAIRFNKQTPDKVYILKCYGFVFILVILMLVVFFLDLIYLLLLN